MGIKGTLQTVAHAGNISRFNFGKVQEAFGNKGTLYEIVAAQTPLAASLLAENVS